MPRSALTGTQKKALKKEAKFVGKLQDAYLRQLKRSEGFQRPALEETHKTLRGEYAFPSKVKDLMKELQRSQGLAKGYFDKIRGQALANFQQQVQPQIVGNLVSGTSGSSALNQALLAARTNLERGLEADYANLEMNLGQSLLNQAQQASVQNANSRLTAAGLQMGRAVQPQISGIGAANPYFQKGQSGPNSTQYLIGQGLQAAATIGGAYLGGPAGAAAGNAAASWGTNALGLS